MPNRDSSVAHHNEYGPERRDSDEVESTREFFRYYKGEVVSLMGGRHPEVTGSSHGISEVASARTTPPTTT